MVDAKNVQGKKNLYGQFFTPDEVAKNILEKIPVTDAVYIEPSYGAGAFLTPMMEKYGQVIGIELDEELFIEGTIHKNFYDFKIKNDKPLIFIGNPPYRTPAYSLTTHNDYIQSLKKKYDLKGIREECVFFIMKTIDLIIENGNGGEIHYIVPNSIIKNNSKFFNNFKMVLKKHCIIENIIEIRGDVFDGVSQDLMYIHLKVDGNHDEQSTTKVNGEVVNLNEYMCLENKDEIDYREIFKNTYLGSVPCESILMSVQGESLKEFRDRIVSIMTDEDIDKESLYNKLSHNGKFHLKIFAKPFSSEQVQKKLDILLGYVKHMQSMNILELFEDENNYKPITNRGDKICYYFRHKRLTSCKEFVYQINPNPCRSFYFPGNPSGTGGDYFGFCDYDVNRNLGPGANRTVPVDNIEENLTDSFKEWWRENTDEPFEKVFDYIIRVSQSDWYKEKKKSSKRFYFCIPKGWLI